MSFIKKLCVFLVFSGALNISAQGILETIFYKLPSSEVFDYDVEKRKEMVEDMKTPNSGHIFDEKNGFLEYVGYQHAYQVCYWTVKYGSGGNESQYQLVAVKFGKNTHFFTYLNGQMGCAHPDGIDGFTALLFFKDNATLGQIKNYKDNYVFQLPRTGLNIVAYYSAFSLDPETDQPGKELLKGDRIDFIYKNGSFVMSAPYFEKK